MFQSVWASVSKCHTGWLINNINLFLEIPEAWKPNIKMAAWSHSGEGPLPGS